MVAVIFEVTPLPGKSGPYLDIAASLRPALDQLDGFISIERFQSLANPAKLLSLSFWRDETAVAAWRQLEQHRQAQSIGREQLFGEYRLRIAGVIRDYSMTDRTQAPPDSRALHG